MRKRTAGVVANTLPTRKWGSFKEDLQTSGSSSGLLHGSASRLPAYWAVLSLQQYHALLIHSGLHNVFESRIELFSPGVFIEL